MKENTKRILIGATTVVVAVSAGVWLTMQSSETPPPVQTASLVQAVPTRVPTNVASLDAQPVATAISGHRSTPGQTSVASEPKTKGLRFGARWDKPDTAPEFAQFADWIQRHRSARSEDERQALETEGVSLATARREAMENLIRNDPERALEWSIPHDARQGLPDSVASLLEKPISDRGMLAVFAALAEPGKESEVTPVWRTATLGGEDYDAFVYGRRLGEPTRRDIPMNGVALGRLVALSENPVRVMDATEAALRVPATVDPLCAVSAQPATIHQTPIAAEVGGRVLRLCGLGHADDLNGRLVQAEGTGGGSGVSNGDTGDVQASAYTEGVKRLLIIRVDFPDLAGDPMTTDAGINLISSLNTFYREMSYDRTGFYLNGSGSSVTPTLRMTNSASYYGTNNYYSRLQNEARAAATAAGYNVSNYDFDVTCFGSVPGWSWAGLGWVGSSGVWLRNYFTTGVAGHELGHNYGLNHANYWDTLGKSVIGNGTSVEYGDVFDTMGSASAGANHFNARYKSYLNWMTADGVQLVTNSGTYRIQPHDDPTATGIRALKIARNSSTNFWVEFRQKFTANAWMMNGAGIRWAGNGNQRSDLLDTTPGSANGKTDSPLVVGRTFSDPASGIHITTLRKAGTTPESLDVVVNLGTFPGNRPPTLNITASSTNPTAGSTVTFTANASDPDNDTLAYYWDFGDGSIQTNGATVSKFSTAADFRVQCTVTDMKGGTATDSILVTYGSPTTYRIAGAVTQAGVPVAGARVSVSSTRIAYTDSDGTYALVGLPAGSYTVSASLDTNTFNAQGFANPVVVGPNATGINFGTGAPSNSPPTIASQPQSQTVAVGATASFAVTATGTGLRYLWQANGTNVPAGTNASLSLPNVQSNHGGNYLVVVTNTGGATTSAVATLTVLQPPGISVQPQGQSLAAGGNVTLSVTATGSGPLAYQWRRNSSAVTGATNNTLTLNPVSINDAGDYSVVVTNRVGSVTSSTATLVVIQAPAIVTQPQGRTVSAASNVTLSVTVSGSAPLVYQWWKNGAAIATATNSSLAFSPAGPADAGAYFVVVTNPVGVVTSAVATLVVNCSYTLASPSASFSGSGGTGSVQMAAHSACVWSVTGVPSWITLTTATLGSGNTTVRYVVSTNTSGSARTATLSIGGLAYQVSQSILDVIPPSIAFTSPADGSTTTSTSLVAQGTSADNIGVSRVEFRCGTNAYAAASGTTNWSATVNLALGTNVVTVRAFDAAGLVSSEAQRTLVRVAPGTITVKVRGRGTVRGATDGQQLTVGQSYTLTAVAEDGASFSNWTGSIVHSSPVLTFVMQSNLEVTANFVPNPFATTKGTFNGLFYETNELDHAHAGFFTFALTVKGAYSASLQTRGWKLAAKGLLDLAGRGTNRVLAPDGQSYTVTWALALDGSDQISGLVTGDGWAAPLLGDRLVFHPTTNAAPQAGRYTALATGDPEQSASPGGDGYGQVAVDTRGAARLSGYLPDQTRFVTKSSLSRQGHWPVYISLYGRQGAILGWVTFRDESTTDLDGSLSWLRPALAGSSPYSAGFVAEPALLGSRYTTPARTEPVVAWTDPVVHFTGGGLPAAFTNSLTVTPSLTGLTGTNDCSVKITPTTGLFSGVIDRPDTGAPLPFRGAILQKSGLGGGYFTSTNGTGQVRVE